MSFTEPVFIILHIASFSLVLSLAVSGFMISAGLLDHPVGRSNHEESIPSAGGIGMVTGVGAGLLALSVFYPFFADQALLGAFAALALAMAFLGLVDDMYDLPPVFKFAAILALSGATVAMIEPPDTLPLLSTDIVLPGWFAFAGTVLWIFVVTNGVNFMDGANGLMSGFMVVAFLFLTGIALYFDAFATALLASTSAAALFGFMPYNTRNKALIFAGDVGALLIGYSFAVCALLLVYETENARLLYIGPFLFLPFLTDVLLTLLVRARRKNKLLSAHSDHLYQRLIRAGRSHISVTVLYAVAAIISGILALIGIQTGLIRSLFYLGFVSCLWSGVYLAWHHKLPNAPD